jgi:hypothetical protein
MIEKNRFSAVKQCMISNTNCSQPSFAKWRCMEMEDDNRVGDDSQTQKTRPEKANRSTQASESTKQLKEAKNHHFPTNRTPIKQTQVENKRNDKYDHT